MKAVRIHSYGGSDRIAIEEAPAPELSSGEVLVRVHDAGVNPVDWKIREGLMKEQLPMKFPLTLGQDFAGIIDVIGPGVMMFKKGDEVFGFAHGSYAELATAKETSLARKPNTIDFATAASIPTAGLTAWQVVIDTAQIDENKKVLIHGAAGGVGSFATQIAKWKGAEVIATASTDDAPYLRELGVDRIIDYRNENFEDRVKDVDVVIDLVGGAVLARSYRVMRKRSGSFIVSTVAHPDANALGRIQATGQRFLMKPNSYELEQLAGLIDQGVVKPRVAEILPLTDAKRAQELLQRGHAHGKIVLQVTH